MCRWLLVCALLFLYAFHANAEPRDEWYIISMGDSITAGFNTRWPGDLSNSRYNWSTGSSKRVESHLHKLKEIISHKIKPINVAKSRSTSYQLKQQLEKVKAPTIDYLTLLIGANDVCDWQEDYAESQQKFRNNVHDIIEKAIEINTEVRIVLPAIPNMYRIYSQGKDKCGGRWDYFEACPSLLSSKRTNEERLAFRDRLISANETLQELATNFTDNVKYVGEVYDYEFTLDHVSRIDCFHPSIKGQNELARITWENGWYL